MIKLNGKIIEQNKFYDGTYHVKYDKELLKQSDIVVKWQYENDGEFLLLQMLCKMLEDKGLKYILDIPYFPNGRMDRTEDSEESTQETLFTLKYFIELLNELNPIEIKTLDPHSDYILENLKNMNPLSIAEGYDFIVSRVLGEVRDDTILMFPDKGAYDRYKDLFPFHDKIYGNKTRDWETGEIIGYEIVGEAPDQSCGVLIIDDICSRGGTFTHALDELDKAFYWWGGYQLYITHCEENIKNGPLFSDKRINRIMTTDSIIRSDEVNSKLQIFQTE